ncbi:signal peptide peptidase SppA [Geitlerinema sp. PCC 9228]|uniref:signal peptide peptidase SppA n=1 Tax=Geitlerinema sp. PCC 9228 TaxID=111611 RepID=UPI0008F9AF11|nr:signal peptide peptidase SppA [Geitlerinema sp. PCC 9228]
MRSFLKYTFATLVGSFLGLFLFLGVGFGSLIWLIVSTASKTGEPTVEDKSVLVFDLSATIRDTQPQLSSRQAVESALGEPDESVLTLRNVLQTLEAAAEDDKIVGLYLRGTNAETSTGYAILREVRQALDEFRESGKPIYAYDLNWSEKEYYLASAANKVFVNPSGMVLINGFSSRTAFYKEALDKYGIGIQVVRAGKYKSAVEPYQRTELSDANRQQTQQLLDDIWREFRMTASRNREIDAQGLQIVASKWGLIQPPTAKSENLVDEVAYFDEVTAQLRELTEQSGEDTASFRNVGMVKYKSSLENGFDGSEEEANNQVAVVYAEGAIVPGSGTLQQVGSNRFSRRLRKLREDENVKAIVMRVNSPGGSATASEVIQREVKLTQQKKPIVISMGNYAASGGYLISTYGSKIYAEPNTITGSIGVYGLLPNVQELGNELGITWDGVKTNPFADLNTISRPKTEAEMQKLRQMVQQSYDRFLADVAQGRELERSQVADLAQGRVWSGVQAQKVGLVDELGGLEDAIAAAASMAELDQWQVQEYPKRSSFEERLLKQILQSRLGVDGEGSLVESQLQQEWQRLKQQMELLATLNDPQHIYALMPYKIEIE